MNSTTTPYGKRLHSEGERRKIEAHANLQAHRDALIATGKTLASLALADFTKTAVYWPIENLCEHVLRGDALDVAASWRAIAGDDLAILDEIGERDQVGDLYLTTLKRFLDTRAMHQQSIAVYISNLAPADLPELFDDRIVSRLLAGTVFELAGDDRRFAGIETTDGRSDR